MRRVRSALLPIVLCGPLLAARGDDFGLDGAAESAADPWAVITQLFPAPGDEVSGRGEERFPSLSPVGEFDLPDTAPEGLSGIAWRGAEGLPGRNDLYALVEDSGGRLHAATIGIDRDTGAITNAVVSPAGAIPGAADLEGLACGCMGPTPVLFASDERGPVIWAKPSLDTSGPDWTALPVPAPLRRCRPNLALEALALSADGRILWTAPEGPLPEDGPVATTERGSLVRLYALDDVITAGPPKSADPPWWFYELDPATGTSFPHLPAPFNGLAALCALPDGRLLALERSFGFRTRGPDDPRGSLITVSIYLVDPLRAEVGSRAEAAEGAEVGSRAEAAEGAGFESRAEAAEGAESVLVGGGPGEAEPPTSARTAAARRPPVLAKTLLWRGLVGRANYEGMTLGPALADDSRALLLVADGDVSRKGRFAFAWRKSLLAFRLKLP